MVSLVFILLGLGFCFLIIGALVKNKAFQNLGDVTLLLSLIFYIFRNIH